jgi:hypothetical protein
MEDPAYKSGVKADSVVSMFRSFTDVLEGKTPYILAPTPTDSIPPVTHINFYPDRSQHPNPLNTHSTGYRSRRLHSYNMSNAPSSISSIANSILEGSEGSSRHSEMDSVHDEIMSAIDGLASSVSQVEEDIPESFVEDQIQVEVGHDSVTPRESISPVLPQRRRRRVVVL